jgi:hypothetical protein
MAITAEEIVARMEQFESDRSNWDNQYQDCGDYGMPQNSQFTSRKSPGETSNVDLYDTTAEESNIQLAAGLYSYMFPTDSRAFVLEIEDEELNEIDDVKQWLEKVTKIIHKHLVNSNFREAFFEYLKSLGCYGTACLYEEKGKKKPIIFICHHLAGIYIAVNSDGEIDTVFRKFEYTARQAVQEFGEENLSEKIVTAYNEIKGKDKKFEFIHAVMPREDADPDKDDPISMPWASIYVSRTDKKLIPQKGLPESGYPEMPHQVSRFDKDSLEVMGRSPMMKKLPDIKMVNAMQKARIKGWEKMVDPPTLVPDDGSIWPLATQPGGVIHYRVGSEPPKYWEFKGDLREMEKAIESVQQTIQKGFFLDMFDPLVDRQNMTATEVMARVEQKMRFLTPIIGRLQSELFNPMIHRIIGILGRQKLIPAMPEQLVGKDYSVIYLGRLALAMRTLETEGLAKTLSEWGPMAEAQMMEWIDNLDVDQAFRDSARNNGMPATWLKEIEKVKALREKRAQQQEAMALMENAKDLTSAVKNLSTAPEEGSIVEGITKNAA